MITQALFRLMNRDKFRVHHDRGALMRADAVAFTGLLTSKRFTEGKEMLFPLCASGDICLLYADRDARLIIGADPDVRYIGEHRRIEREHSDLPLRFLNEDCTSLPYPNASFDTVVIGDGISRHPDPLPILREASRLLRPGGILCLSILPHYAPHACGCDLISLPYATLLFGEATRCEYLTNLIKRMDPADAACYAPLLIHDTCGKAHLTTEARHTISSMKEQIRSLDGMSLLKWQAIPLKKILTLLCKIPVLREITTSRLLIVLERNTDFRENETKMG